MSAYPQPPFPRPGPQGPILGRVTRKRAWWKRVLGWTLFSLAGLIILIVVGVYGLLHNDRFHHYLLGMAQSKATQALGSEVQAGNFVLSWSGISPAVEINNIVV
ncbi:MAG TPA: hypothetical protein VGF06_12760, partial [Terriglobales bacterium]